MVTAEDVQQWISNGLSAAEVIVEGDGRHFQALIISEAFEGKNTLQRHRLVYKALGDRMKADVHALSMQTYTPEEYQEQA